MTALWSVVSLAGLIVLSVFLGGLAGADPPEPIAAPFGGATVTAMALLAPRPKR